MKPIHINPKLRSNSWQPARRVWFQKNDDNISEFEAEKHSNDTITCAGCGKKMNYTGGFSSYCSDCRRGGLPVRKKRHSQDYYD